MWRLGMTRYRTLFGMKNWLICVAGRNGSNGDANSIPRRGYGNPCNVNIDPTCMLLLALCIIFPQANNFLPQANILA